MISQAQHRKRTLTFAQTTCTCCWLVVAGLLINSLLAVSIEPQQQQTASTPQARLAAARLRAASSGRQPAQPKLASQGTAVEVSPPQQQQQQQPQARANPINSPTGAQNRSIRTADVFQNGDGFNLFVTNTCERESMRVNIRTSRPFYGVIHTRNQRQKPACSIEANGDTEYNLDISHILNEKDPSYCGAVRARKESPEDKDLISVVLAVRVHRNIELSDDKFFLLNCTNRCRKADCSNPSDNLTADDKASGKLRDFDTADDNAGERETIAGNQTDTNNPNQDECTPWKFPWLITLLWCMGILILALLISHCIICSSMVCKCVKTEVEEQEPSIYEGASDCDDDRLYNKRHPYRIDYDNRDIYKTSNNYAPYNLEDAQHKSSNRSKDTTERKRSRRSAAR